MSLIGPQGTARSSSRSTHSAVLRVRVMAFELGDQRGAVLDAQRVAGVARVGGDFGVAGGLAEAGELAVIADGEQHGAVAGREVLVGGEAGVGVALAARRRRRC